MDNKRGRKKVDWKVYDVSLPTLLEMVSKGIITDKILESIVEDAEYRYWLNEYCEI